MCLMTKGGSDTNLTQQHYGSKTSSFYPIHHQWVTDLIQIAACHQENPLTPVCVQNQQEVAIQNFRGRKHSKAALAKSMFMMSLCFLASFYKVYKTIFTCVSILEPALFIGSYWKCMSVIRTSGLFKYIAEQVKANFLYVWKAAEMYIANCDHDIFICFRDLKILVRLTA